MKWTQKQLKPELDSWIRDGLLEASSAELILKRYPLSGKNYWVIAFASIGSILCLAGIILLIAGNWQDISAPLKFGGLLALLAGSLTLGVETQRRGWHRAWWECAYLAAAIFPLLGVVLISQIFHVYGKATDLMVFWILAIAPLPFLTRSVGSFVVWLLAWMSLLICFVDESHLQHDFETFCGAFIVFGLVTAFVSKGWLKLGENILHEVGEFWGLLCALIAAYVLGFEVKAWELLWFAVFLACLGLIYRGYSVNRPHQVNMGFVMVALIILSVFFRLIGSMLDTGLMFIAGGGTLLAVVYGANRLRRQVLEKMS